MLERYAVCAKDAEMKGPLPEGIVALAILAGVVA